MTQKKHKGGHGHGASHLTDESGQLLQLEVERSLHVCLFRGRSGHFANLRLIAHGGHRHASVPTHDQG